MQVTHFSFPISTIEIRAKLGHITHVCFSNGESINQIQILFWMNACCNLMPISQTI